ncbi:MAG: C4-type zinc ribbon domain-containing protein [Candidatus Omnitrophica bacterium]|nr:C4-type zinc ribbon domain-containing protein [Candidatus Omnitrophota bacterium]
MITENIEKLIKLQNIDIEILEKEEEINSLFQKEKEFNKKIEIEEKKIKEIKEELKKLQLDKKEKELEIKSYEEEVKNLNQKLDNVKTNKEYEALLIEIANFKKKISEIEEQLLILMEAEDEKIKKEKFIEEELKKVKEDVFKKMEEEKKKAEELKKEVSKKKQEREIYIKEIPSSDYLLYEKIRKTKKDNIAIAKVEDGVCSGCNMSLPTYIVEMVKKKEKVVQCENCSRILY